MTRRATHVIVNILAGAYSTLAVVIYIGYSNQYAARFTLLSLGALLVWYIIKVVRRRVTALLQYRKR